MTKDRRLYARFDIGMDEHPKVLSLSDAAFRALIESTMYCRRQLTDGFLDARVTHRKWGADVVAELTSNDSVRPSWVKVDGGYQIHDFAEHQTTTADIQAKRDAGRAGGLAKASRTVAPASEPLAPATEVLKQNAGISLAKTETETETVKKTSSATAKPSPEFDAFWAAYPRKKGKIAGRKAFDKAMKLTTIEQILSGVALLRRETAGKEEHFTPHAASWLNAGRWDDAPDNTTPTLSGPWSKEFHQ